MSHQCVDTPEYSRVIVRHPAGQDEHGRRQGEGVAVEMQDTHLQKQEVESRILCTIRVGRSGGFSIRINNTYTTHIKHKRDSSGSV